MDVKLDRRQLFFAAAAVAAGPVPAPVRLPRRVRLGLLGIEGSHISEIINPLPRLPDVEVVALCDPDAAERARIAAHPRVGGARQYADWRLMLEREQLDLVAINNNNGDRAKTILACAARGLAVMSEKPLALTRADLAAVKQAVASKKIALGMQLPMRFSAAYATLKKVVSEGLIGEVAQMAAQKSYQLGTSRGPRASWFFRHESYGGTIPWIGIHMIDLMRWTSGREYRQVAGFKARVGFPSIGDMENVTASLFKLDNGGVGTLHMDYLRPNGAAGHGDDRLRLAGTKGIVEYQPASGLTLVTEEKSAARLEPVIAPQPAFIDYLLATYAGQPPTLPLADIYRVNEVALAAHEAAMGGRVLDV
jgi:predicted dehydrogenase